MTLFHFLNCAALTFGPHAVYYKATPLSELDTVGICAKTAFVCLATTLIKLGCIATFLQIPDNDNFQPYQEFLKAVIGLLDAGGLYFALTRLTCRGINKSDKFQAVGLGWAFADSLLHRLLPLWVGARGMEFTWDYLLQGIESNAALIFTVSLAALEYLVSLRKRKPPTLVPIIYACAAILATMPTTTSYLRLGLGWDMSHIVGFEVGASIAMALITWRLVVACQ